MNSNGGKDNNLENDLLLEQCRLGYDEFKSNKANLHRFALAGFSGLMIIAGLLATQGSQLPQAMQHNPHILLIFLIYPVIGSVYSMLGLVFVARVTISHSWLIYNLRLLGEHSPILQDSNSFFLIFDDKNEVWKGFPWRLRWCEIVTTVVYWSIVLFTSIFCYVVYLNWTKRNQLFGELTFWSSFVFSGLIFLFCTLWVIILVTGYIREQSVFRDDFIKKTTHMKKNSDSK